MVKPLAPCLDFLERTSSKRKIKPPTSDVFINIDDLEGESSDDSDFRIEDHCAGESDYSGGSDLSEGSENGSESEGGSDISTEKQKDAKLVNGIREPFNEQLLIHVDDIDIEVLKHVLICCVCLGDRSDDTNEIIECDGCGITVHEGCYGVQDTASVSSSASSCSTEPWFCEACRAGVENPTCELCPNFGGIFKETDVGKWVHLVCALYIPGIAFGEPDKLSSVTLFEIPSNKWGYRACQLCQDTRLVHTGMTIECDAGMCRAFFHVTCGQREGLLADAVHDEVEQADPFFAHCKLHSDKNQIKRKKRNWAALQARAQKMIEIHKKGMEEEPKVWKRYQRKLSKYRVKYSQMKIGKPTPWVPMQKRPRLMTTSASACRALWRKSELMGVDMVSFEQTEALISTIQDIPKKWNIPPAFSVEFIGYFLDRDARVSRLKKQLSCHAEEKTRLTNEQQKIQQIYDATTNENFKANAFNSAMQNTISIYHDIILKMKPKAKLPDVENIGKSISNTVHDHNSYRPKPKVPATIILKAGTHHSESADDECTENEEVRLSVKLHHRCGICSKSNDQHLLVKCDTCGKYYHLGCLDPPLTRMPTKTKIFGWQCSYCDKESGNSDIESVNTEAPRKLRRSSKERDIQNNEFADHTLDVVNNSIEVQKGTKRKRDKHRSRYSPEFVLSHNSNKHNNRKRKHRSGDRENSRQGIKLFIKSVPNSSGETESCAPTFVAKTEEYTRDSPQPVSVTEVVPESLKSKRKSLTSPLTEVRCNTCNEMGTNSSTVSCDDCSKAFHFRCLDPPVKKSPKVRGYSWHCANCDPSNTESE